VRILAGLPERSRQEQMSGQWRGKIESESFSFASIIYGLELFSHLSQDVLWTQTEKKTICVDRKNERPED
jgi:hypothetical protein